jgi:hypothetical protein
MAAGAVVAVQPRGEGGQGGNGGNVTLHSNNTLTDNGAIFALGGAGGSGGSAHGIRGVTTAGNDGANGGSGGNVYISATNSVTLYSRSFTDVNGGKGGNGGSAHTGNVPLFGATPGGLGGYGGNAGAISIRSGNDVTDNGDTTANGGAGGNGGSAKANHTSNVVLGGAGGNGGKGGTTTITAQNITVNGDISDLGGKGGAGGSAKVGAGGSAAVGGDGGRGGAGGIVTLKANNNLTDNGTILAYGGLGGSGGRAHAGFLSTAQGGHGGAGGDGGHAHLSAGNILTMNNEISVDGGNGGKGGNATGTIGAKTIAGAGGNGSRAGCVTLLSNNTVTDTHVIDAFGGSGGTGGNAPHGTGGKGGNGGLGGNAVLVATNQVSDSGGIFAYGGNGGSGGSGHREGHGGNGGSGGGVTLTSLGQVTVSDGVNVDGGNGGNGATGHSGIGGNGGGIAVLADGNISLGGAFTAKGGTSPDGVLKGGTGGTITLAAGVNQTTTVTGCNATVVVHGPVGGSSTGGSISEINGTPISVNASGPAGGGQIAIVAYQGSNPGSGQIQLPGSTVTNGGAPGAPQGFVTIIAPNGINLNQTISNPYAPGGVYTGPTTIALAQPQIFGGSGSSTGNVTLINGKYASNSGYWGVSPTPPIPPISPPVNPPHHGGPFIPFFPHNSHGGNAFAQGGKGNNNGNSNSNNINNNRNNNNNSAAFLANFPGNNNGAPFIKPILPTDITDQPTQWQLQGQISLNAYEQSFYQEKKAGQLARLYLEGGRTYSSQFTKDEFASLYKQGRVSADTALEATANANANIISISKGNVVFAPDRDIIVKTRDAEVRVAAGSVVLVMETGADSAFYSLSQSRPSAVQVSMGNKKASLVPGRMIAVANQTKKFEELDSDLLEIASRKPIPVAFQENKSAYTADFSIPSAIERLQPLREMFQSNDPRDQKTINQLIKYAAVIMSQSAAQGPYQRHLQSRDNANVAGGGGGHM